MPGIAPIPGMGGALDAGAAGMPGMPCALAGGIAGADIPGIMLGPGGHGAGAVDAGGMPPNGAGGNPGKPDGPEIGGRGCCVKGGLVGTVSAVVVGAADAGGGGKANPPGAAG